MSGEVDVLPPVEGLAPPATIESVEAAATPIEEGRLSPAKLQTAPIEGAPPNQTDDGGVGHDDTGAVKTNAKGDADAGGIDVDAGGIDDDAGEIDDEAGGIDDEAGGIEDEAGGIEDDGGVDDNGADAVVAADDSAKGGSSAPAPAAEDDEDLEDGEIDDDEDDNSGDVVLVSASKGAPVAAPSFKLPDVVDLISDNSSGPAPVGSAASGNKKSKVLEEDYAVSIENAIASALKKKGIEPTMPKVLESRNGQSKDGKSTSPGPFEGQSRSSRRRKRKKQREEKEKEKDKKRQRYDSGNQPPNDDVEMDDYEMLNVRGGSPPPFSHAPQSGQAGMYKDYDSQDDSASSMDSYDSAGGGMGNAAERRRARRSKKESGGRKRRDRSGRGGGGGGRDDDDYKGGRQEKRNRRDSPEHRQEPRKLELCKFYLMECCAKRDKCSYMHGDFPCKYYYLGMDCVAKDGPCKFSHGEPLTDQLRNILLKHLETAPKEILGNFKRISRDSAIAQITKRHEELCKEYDVENTWSGVISLPHVRSRGNHGGGGGGGCGGGGGGQNVGGNVDSNGGAAAQQLQLQQQQQLHQQTLTANTSTSITTTPNPTTTTNNLSSATANIPSLLDMVIKPPPQLATSSTGCSNNNSSKNQNSNNNNNDKQMLLQQQQQQRKSRWTEGAGKSRGGSTTQDTSLDLSHLQGVLSDEHIEKLSQLGIKNLEQVNQLTFGQMNEIGLTIAEIGEIQKIAQKGLAKETPKKDDKKDVDLREVASSSSRLAEPEQDQLVSTNSNSNSNSSNVVVVDYSQYLKDSHLGFDRSDNLDDDERDDEQLVIDDGHTDNEEQPASTPDATPTEEKTFIPQPPKLQMSDLSQSLKSSLNTLVYSSNTDKTSKSRDPRSNPFRVSDDEKATAGDDESRPRSRSATPTRSQSSTPEAIQSPEPESTAHNEQPTYERATMYDGAGDPSPTDDDISKGDKDMRYLPGATAANPLSDIDLRLPFDKRDKDMRSNMFSDIDLRLPFQPVMNYTPATEIDGSISSHTPMPYKAYEVDIRKPSFADLRKTIKTDDTNDPRLRRILGLPELPGPAKASSTALPGKRSSRKLSNTIASPESDGASPMYYTPPPMGSGGISAPPPPKEERKGPAAPRLDPRRAAKQQQQQQQQQAAQTQQSRGGDSSFDVGGSGSSSVRQVMEIRELLQKSEWYKNLSSKFKIMANQQMALVFTELKKFHQNPAPNKIFDIGFIVSNTTLQQILTNLGIYIDDNGEVSHIDGDGNMDRDGMGNVDLGSPGPGLGMGPRGGMILGGITLPNLSQPPPSQPQLDFLRAPPPNMGGGGVGVGPMFRGPGVGGGGGVGGPANPMNMPAFAGPGNNRPSLLGMPPVMGGGGNGGGGGGGGGGFGNPFNPFAHNQMQDQMGGGPGPGNFGGVNLMGPGGANPLVANAFANALLQANLQQQQHQQQQQRNFGGGNQRNNNQRQQQNRRNNFGGGGGNK